MLFDSREAAGVQLADALSELSRESGVVCAVACGGIPVGGAIARLFGWPLDVVWVRRILHPASDDYAIAALGEDGELAMNESEAASADRFWLERKSSEARLDIRHWKSLSARFRRHDLEGKTVLIVDDGLVTGCSMRAALRSAASWGAARLVAAIPVAPLTVASGLASQADELIILHAVPYLITSLESCYRQFDELSEGDAMKYLEVFSNEHPNG